ncbi:hypothetical protein WJX72_011242 [[Myrmecia] bisecta]|uniref:F-box protein n=1 Tax=[Myrmecia] bisecta TaxID=41462 RepID=A0AAW1QGX8_9CHLO
MVTSSDAALEHVYGVFWVYDVELSGSGVSLGVHWRNAGIMYPVAAGSVEEVEQWMDSPAFYDYLEKDKDDRPKWWSNSGTEELEEEEAEEEQKFSEEELDKEEEEEEEKGPSEGASPFWANLASHDFFYNILAGLDAASLAAANLACKAWSAALKAQCTSLLLRERRALLPAGLLGRFAVVRKLEIFNELKAVHLRTQR